MTEREALKLALEAFEEIAWSNSTDWQRDRAKGAITAIKEALAQPEQEPLAYGMWDTMLGKGNRMMMVRLDKGQDGCTVPLYTTPPQPEPVIDKSAAVRIATALGWEPKRTWVGLTLDERSNCYEESDGNLSRFAKAIEAKLKEKNT